MVAAPASEWTYVENEDRIDAGARLGAPVACRLVVGRKGGTALAQEGMREARG